MRYAGNEDKKLNEFKEYVNSAVKVFVDALPNMKEKMSFKAFEIGDVTDEEGKNFADVILTQFAIRLKEIVPETLEIYTYNGTIVRTDDDMTQVWFHAENKAPGKPEKIELEEDIEVMAKTIEDTPILCGASGMGHIDPAEHLVSKATYDA